MTVEEGVAQEDKDAARSWLEDACGKHLANQRERELSAQAFAAHRTQSQAPLLARIAKLERILEETTNHIVIMYGGIAGSAEAGERFAANDPVFLKGVAALEAHTQEVQKP